MAGLTPAVSSPFGNSGNNLSPMQPEQPAIPDIGGVGNIMSTPAPAAAAPAEADPFAALGADAGGEEDPFAALGPDVGGGAPLVDEADGMSDLPAPEGMASLKEQFSESVARLKNSFAVTGPESIQVLKASKLFDDVRDVDGTIQVKRRGRKGWEDFDRDKFELVGDVLDFTRDGIEAIVENTFRAGGTAGGGAGGTIVAPGPGTVAGGYAGMAAAGAAGAVAAKNAGDYVALKLGIERDPNRSRLKENALAAAFGGGFTMIGSVLARRAAARAAAKSAARNEAQKTVEYATEQVAETMKDIAEVKNSGIVLGEHGNFHLDPQQMVGKGNIPELDITAKELSTEQSFRNFRRDVGNSIQNAYDSVAQTLGAQAGKGATIADDFVLTANDVRKAEGAAIGAFRNMAKSALGTKKLPAMRTAETSINLLKKYGGGIESVVTPEGSVLKPVLPKVQTILRDNPALSPTQARLYRHEIANIAMRLHRGKGQMRIDDMEVIYNDLTRKINNSIDTPNGRAYAKSLIELKNAVREDWTDMIGKVLPESEQAAYAAAKQRYGSLISATDQLGRILETDNITRNELISKLFEGKGSYKFAQSAKTLIQETNPQMWDNLSAEYFKKLRNDATNVATNTVSWSKMTRKWRELDPRLQQDLLNSTGMTPQAMNSLLQLGNRVEHASFDAMAKETQKTVLKRGIKNVLIFWRGGGTAQGSAVGSLLDGMGKDQALAKWLKDGGMEEVLKEMPGLKPEKAASLRSWIADWTPRPVRAGAKAVTKGAKATGVTSTRRYGEEGLSAQEEVEAEEPIE